MPSHTDPPVDVVCAIIRHENGLILLAQRPEGKRLAGLWEFPGGKVDPGEQPEESLHRELMEELGCLVTVTQAGPAVVHEYEWGSIRLFPFICELMAGSSPPHPHEHAALSWVPFEKILSHDLAPADLPIVKWAANLA